MNKKTEQFKAINSMGIMLTKKCNYQCEYCISWSGRDKNHLYQHMADETIENLKTLLIRIPKGCELCFVGGEPTFHPRFQEVATTSLELGHSLAVITNFSLPNKYFYPLIDISQNKGWFFLVLSLHLSQLYSQDDFLQKVFELKEYMQKKQKQEKTNLVVSAVVTDENYHKLKNIENILAQKNIRLLFNHKRNNDNVPIVYSNKEIHCDLINWQNSSGKNNYLINCNAGKNYLFITEMGEAIRCTDYSCLPNKTLGNINKEIQLYKESTICLAPKCICHENMAPNFYKNRI